MTQSTQPTPTYPLPEEYVRAVFRGTKPAKAVNAEAPGRIDQLIISTPEFSDDEGNVTRYNGETFGVRFNDGVAVVTKHRKHKYGYSINRLAWLFLHDSPGNYTVEIIYEPGGEPTPDEPGPTAETEAEAVETAAPVPAAPRGRK